MQPDPLNHEDMVSLRIEVSQIKEDVALIRHHITGNGDPSKGIIVRLDRLERRIESDDERKNRIIWFFRALTGGVLAAIGLSIWQFLAASAGV